MTVDFAHTDVAERNRLSKADALAAVALQLGVDANGLAVGTGNRRRVWKAAGLKRAPSEATWMAVVDVLGLPVPAPTRPQGPPTSGPCLFHPGRPGRLYLCGYRCPECSPAALAGRTRPVPPPGTTAAERRPVGAAHVDEFEPWVAAARAASPASRTGCAVARAELATRVFRRGLAQAGPAP